MNQEPEPDLDPIWQLIVESPLFKQMMRQAEERAVLAKARQYILENLRTRFGPVPKEVAEKIGGISDAGQLDVLNRRVITAQSLDEFVRALDE